MKSVMTSLVLALALALVPASACSKKNDDKAAAKEREHQLANVTVAELDALLAKGACTAVDANGPETRKNKGVIPGAIRLTDYETFAATELPADKSRPLVFYCANEKCRASHTAAEKALASGHKDVKVLSAGILGWTAAGKPVEPGA